MVFNLHYIADPASPLAGEIYSYQEGPEKHLVADVPAGCKLLCFASTPDVFDENGKPTVKVDLTTEELVYKIPPTALPKPIKP